MTNRFCQQWNLVTNVIRPFDLIFSTNHVWVMSVFQDLFGEHLTNLDMRMKLKPTKHKEIENPKNPAL